MKTTLSGLAATLLFAACGGASTPEAPSPPAARDIAGTYAITADTQGQTISGSMVIAGTADAYTGSISSEMGDVTMTDIVVDGDVMTFTIPEFGVDFTLVFDGDSFTGEFGGAMGSGTILGMKEGGS